MFKKTLLVSGIALAVSAPALAAQQTTAVRDNGFSYSYGQLAYDRWDLDNDVDVDSLSAEGSFALDEHLFLRGSLGFFDGDYGRNGDLDGCLGPDVQSDRGAYPGEPILRHSFTLEL